MDGERTRKREGQPFCLVFTRSGTAVASLQIQILKADEFIMCSWAPQRERERARKWEGNRKRLKNMAQPVLWEFKHIKTIKLCHLFWCTIAPCACLARRGLDGWQRRFCYYIWDDKSKRIGCTERKMVQRWVGRDIKAPWNQIQTFVAFSPCALDLNARESWLN